MKRVTALLVAFILLLLMCSSSCNSSDALKVLSEVNTNNITSSNDSPASVVSPNPSFDAPTTPFVTGEDPFPTPQAEISIESPTPSSTPNPAPKIDSIPDWYKSNDTATKVPVLMYHNLLNGSSSGDGLNVSEKFFDDQMYHVKAYGYNTISFNKLYDHYMNGSSLPENPIIITFDDGYESNYTIGYPILKKYGLEACIFVITNAIGNKNYMNEAQIKEIASNGVVDIQSHSASHSYDLPSMKKDDISSELNRSKEKLENIASKKVNVFCYPYGRYSQRLVNELIEQNYIFSVTTKYGIASKTAHPFLLPRIRVMGSDSGITLKNKIEKSTGRKTAFIGIPNTPDPEPTNESPLEPNSEQSSEPSTDSEQEQSPESSPEPEQEQPPESSPEPEQEQSPTPSPNPEYVPDSVETQDLEQSNIPNHTAPKF